MERSCFDEMTKSLAEQGASRRRLLGGVAALVLSGLGVNSGAAAACRKPGSTCREHSNCCSGYCLNDGRGRRLCATKHAIPVSAFDGQDGIGRPTGIVLKSGQSVAITAHDVGATCNTIDTYCENGPNGNVGETLANALAPTLTAFSLIARVGNGPWVPVGAGPTFVSGTGQIYLAYNDSRYDDNDGFFQAFIWYA